MAFANCVEELVKIFEGFDWAVTAKESWDEQVAEYREDKDCEKMLTRMARKLNLWSRLKSTTNVADDCPEAYLGQVMSADGKVDWTRLVWLLYCKLELHRTFAFRRDLLSTIEEYLGGQRERGKGVEGPDAFESCTLDAVRKALGAYCSATSAKEDELSAKRRYIKELNDLMLATDLTNPDRGGLSRIIEKCEGLMVMIDSYMERQTNNSKRKHFDTFAYQHAMTFDVRDVIHVIEEKSRKMLKSLSGGGAAEHEKAVTLSPRRYAMCAELLMKIFARYELHIVWADKRRRKFEAYRQDHDSVALLTYCANFVNEWHRGGGRCFVNKPGLREPGPPELGIRIMSPDGTTDWTRMVWLLSFDAGQYPLTSDSLATIEALLEEHGRLGMGVSYPMCAELLMQIFEKFDLKIVWAGERRRAFEEYMQNEDSVKILTYCARFIHDWFKFDGICFKTKAGLPNIGPPTFNFQLMSPDGQTDWTRMVWLLADQTAYAGRHSGNEVLPPDTLPEVEAHLQKSTVKFAMRGRRKMWERDKQARAAETQTGGAPTDVLLADVARKLKEEKSPEAPNAARKLKEEKSPEAPSRARSRTRSPDPRHSPLPQASPRARVRGGAGGGGYTRHASHLSELLAALHALL